MGPKHKDDFEPYWQDEKDWLCIVEFLPTDDPEARLFAGDIIGYLVGYANLTNTRSLALLGDPDASAYELLFSFSSPEEKNEFLNLVRSEQVWLRSDPSGAGSAGSLRSGLSPAVEESLVRAECEQRLSSSLPELSM